MKEKYDENADKGAPSDHPGHVSDRAKERQDGSKQHTHDNAFVVKRRPRYQESTAMLVTPSLTRLWAYTNSYIACGRC